MKKFGPAASVSALALAGQAVSYMLAITLARHLGVHGFEAYVVGAAAFVLMVTVVPRGLEKYALRVIPVLLDRSDWGRARGYVSFSLRHTLWTAVLVGTAVAISAWFVPDFAAEARLAVIASCIALPAGAVVRLGAEVLTGLQHPLIAIVVVRVGVPAVALAIFGVLLALRVEVSGALAVSCWTVAWIAALAMLAVQIWRAAPPETLRALAVEEPATWVSEARPFWIYRIAIAVMGQAGILVMEWLQSSPSALGAYAAALATAGLAKEVVAATNRLYAGRLSVLVARRDFESIRRMRHKWYRWIAVVVATYLIATLGFTREILGLFRPEFVEEGVTALRLQASAAAIVMLLSLAPTYVKFRGGRRATYLTVTVATAVQITLLLLLVPSLGATGAAIAYGISMCGLYGNFARLALIELKSGGQARGMA